MNHTTRSARTPSLRTGTAARLVTSLRGGGGSGAGSLGGGRTSSLRLLALLALASGALLALTAASATAAETHVFAGSFGSEGSGAGQLNEPSGLAVDQTSGDVYVADTGNNRVERFSSIGATA